MPSSPLLDDPKPGCLPPLPRPDGSRSAAVTVASAEGACSGGGGHPGRLRAEEIVLDSLGASLSARLCLPEAPRPAPAVVICHGAGEFKENYGEMAEALARRGIASLVLDMHGHGDSGGDRYHVVMREWVADVRAAVDFLGRHPGIAPDRIGAFGISSGGTAILEAALIEPRLKSLVTLGATVRGFLSPVETWAFKLLGFAGRLKTRVTGTDLRLSLLRFGSRKQFTSDPEVQQRLLADARLGAAFEAFPVSGGADAFFVDTLSRVGDVRIPTLVLWGADDELDPPATARVLYRALTCRKDIQIIPGNGHAGHMDRHRAKVFELTADWLLETMPGSDGAPRGGAAAKSPRALIIDGPRARSIGAGEKWELLSPFLKRYGDQALSYATLQGGMEYFVTDYGYLAYNTARHPVLAPDSRRIGFADPVCARRDMARLLCDFLEHDPQAAVACVSEPCAQVLHDLGFKVNCIGPEVELDIPSYNTLGNWKDLDLIKRARNEARREGLTIREVDIATVDRDQLTALSKRWIGTKKVSDREIWIYARRAIFEAEPDVRKFVAFDREGRVAGFVFYDPIYRDGRVIGYSANVSRCDEARFGRLSTAIHMEAMERFKPEGKEVLNLNLAPFTRLDEGRFNDDAGAKSFFKLSERFGNDIYNFRGLAFHKSKYRGREKFLYFASNGLMPSNDIFLGFQTADIAQSYFGTLGLLMRGMYSAARDRLLPRASRSPSGTSPTTEHEPTAP